MKKKFHVAGLAALLAAPMAFAADMPAGSIAGYLTNLDVGGADGTGIGIRGWATVADPWFVHGEFQTVTVEAGPFEADLTEIRLGGGFTGKLNPTAMWLAKAEYIDLGGDFDQSGFGLHGGVMLQATPQFGFGATLGYLTTDDTDGLELNFGGKFAFTKEWAGVLDYRTYMGEADGGGDFDVDEIRLGAAYMFY
ncbi:MAG: hypothetical protein ACRES8_04610 [Nevskiaceae bacterium]